MAPSNSDYLLARMVADDENTAPTASRSRGMTIPGWLNYQEGDYAHQGEAIQAWELNDRQGIWAIATGGGKTLTSLVAATRLKEERGKLLVIIGVPTNPLFEQWCDEIREFGLEAAFTGRLSKENKLKKVREALDRLFFGVSEAEAIVCTLDFLSTPDFEQLLQGYQTVSQLLILDEVHNFGVPSFLQNLPEWIPYRLGLSATPIRQYDEEGTEKILQFFGGHEKPVYEFSLDDAIGKCLTPYDYFLHVSELDDDELEEWVELSDKIRQRFAMSGGEIDGDDQLTLLLTRRRKIVETASSKVATLETLLSQKSKDELSHSLIYLTGKDPEQMEQVHEVLDRLGHTYHRVTEQETGRAKVLNETINSFREGHLTFLTAKKVLDEGFNMPEIRRAFILASETTEKQWVQRRGRVLRKSPGKTHAEIHDFIALPASDLEADSDTKKLVQGELKRCEEFARLAANRARADGPEVILNAVRIKYS